MFRKLSVLLTALLSFALMFAASIPAFAQSGDEAEAIRPSLFLPFVRADHNASEQAAESIAEEEDLTDTIELSAAHKDEEDGAVYVTTNANDPVRGNEVVLYRRASDGSLSVAGRFATNGQGLGSGLGSQGALVLSNNGRWLFAVNAGSNEISVFAVYHGGLVLTDKVASGGIRPTSITVRKNVVYVLNAGDPGNITGFLLNKAGKLTLIPDSTRFLSNNGSGPAPAPAQVSFSPNGKLLIVTERASKTLDTYLVDRTGLAYGPFPKPSAGTTPFGFAFGRKDTLIVSEAFGGAVNGSAASSYTTDKYANLNLVSASVPTGQTAACWIVVTNKGHYAYTTNAGSASLSLYAVGEDGNLSLLNAQAGLTGDGTGPTDAAVNEAGNFLYALSPRSQTVIGFAVQADGSLVNIGGFAGLPPNSAGLAAW